MTKGFLASAGALAISIILAGHCWAACPTSITIDKGFGGNQGTPPVVATVACDSAAAIFIKGNSAPTINDSLGDTWAPQLNSNSGDIQAFVDFKPTVGSHVLSISAGSSWVASGLSVKGPANSVVASPTIPNVSGTGSVTAAMGNLPTADSPNDLVVAATSIAPGSPMPAPGWTDTGSPVVQVGVMPRQADGTALSMDMADINATSGTSGLTAVYSFDGTALTAVGGEIEFSPVVTVSTNIPPPPVLTNPTVFKTGANIGGNVVGSNGSTNYNALVYAMTHGNGQVDAQAASSPYPLTVPSGSSGFQPVSGAIMYCENDRGNRVANIPPDPRSGGNNPPVIFAAPLYNNTLWKAWNNGEVYGCEWEGYHYPNTTWSSDGSSFTELVGGGTGTGGVVSNFKWYGNGIDGWAGNVGAIDIYTSFSDWQAGNVDSNFDISFNAFRNFNGRAFENDMIWDSRFTYNRLIDAQQTGEIQYNTSGSSQKQQDVLTDHNHFTWINGIGGGSNSPYNNLESTGWASKSGGSGSAVDYSQSTFSNNIIDGAQTNWMLVGTTGNGCFGVNSGVYCGNTCSGPGCSEKCGPGNPSANYWSQSTHGSFCPNGSTQ